MTSSSKGKGLTKLLRSARGLPRRLVHVGRVALDILYWTATLQVVSRLRVRRYSRVIRRSGLFDERFYLSQCGADPDARRDPLVHYVLRGAALGLDPNPLFDTSAYVAMNPLAAAPRKNPLVHFIRSGGSAAQAAPPSAPPERGQVRMSAGEKLLFDHPFLPPSSLPGPDAGRVLVVDPGMQTADGDCGSLRTFGIVKLLHELGCAVTFASDRAPSDRGLDDPLRRLGIEVHDGFESALAHLAAEGHRYRCAVLSGPEQAFSYLPFVRGYCPQAKVIYDPVPLERVARGADPRATNEAARRELSERLERMDRANAACCDVVLVVTPEERDALLSRMPAARVEVSPQLQTAGRDSEVVKGRIEFLLFGHSIAEPGAQREGRSAREGSRVSA